MKNKLLDKEKKINKNKYQLKVYNNINNLRKNIKNKSNKINTSKNHKKYINKIILNNLKDSKNISIDYSNHSSIENNTSFNLFSLSLSSLTIPNNYILKNKSQKNYKMKNKTFYINKKYYNSNEIIKKYKTYSNFKIKIFSDYFKDFKSFNNFKTINNKKRLKNIFAKRKKEKTIKKQKFKKSHKYSDLTLEKLFNIENNAFIRNKFYKTVSYYKIYYKKNIERKDSTTSLNYSNIFKKLGIKDNENFNKIKRKSQNNFKNILNNDNGVGNININFIEEEIEKIKLNKIKNAEKIKLIWEKKFGLFKEYIKNNKNASFKEFLELNDKEKEIEKLNFDLKLSNVDRINNFKRYIRDYRKKMKELRNEYNIIFKHPCIFDNGQNFK